MNLALDFLVLFAMGAAPAALILFMIRRRLTGPASPFWTALASGLGVLGLGVMLAIWIALMASEDEMLACEVRRAAPECANAGLWVAVAGTAGAFAILVFLAGALVIRLRARRRAASAG
jgi:hypothetical protein